MVGNVAVAVCDGVDAFELGVFCQVFGLDRSACGLPSYEFAVCAAEAAPLRTTSGYSIDTPHGLERLATADLVAIPSWRDPAEQPPEVLLHALRDTVERGARVLSSCCGAFVLAAAGLLDGRRATTHWVDMDLFAARYPAVDLDRNALYVDAGPVLTSAGTAAAIDLCLYVVRQAHGASVANAIARRMVMPPHRDGGQAQFVETPVAATPADEQLADLLDWARAHLDEPLTVGDMAARAHLSARTLARRFAAVAGTTPHRWLLTQRLLLAQQLLECDGAGIEEVARRAGFGTAANLRVHFSRRYGTSPQAYRLAFRGRDR
jgi:transcriptional regulator GlxA family with amidase domain